MPVNVRPLIAPRLWQVAFCESEALHVEFVDRRSLMVEFRGWHRQFVGDGQVPGST